MSDWELRLLLLVIGIIILVIIYVLGNKQKPLVRPHEEGDAEESEIEHMKGSLRAEPKSHEANTDELGNQVRQLDEIVKEEAEFRSGQHPQHNTIAHSSYQSSPKPRAVDRKKALDENLVILHVAATHSGVFEGTSLLRAFKDVRLEYDKSQIFYRCTERFSEKQILFGVVNSVNPGTFDLDRMKDLKTPGISLFMRLPAPIDSLKAFNIMLDCAQNLASFLNAEIHNEYHSVLTKQTIDHMREEIQLYSLRHAQLRKA